MKEASIDLIKNEAIEYGDFTLKSGKKSSWYLDCRKITLQSVGLNYIVSAIHQVLQGVEYDAIGGPCVGADPIVGAMLGCGRTFEDSPGIATHRPIRGFLVRSEPKAHGKSDLIIGSVKPGDRVVLVEDVTTTGSSLYHAAALLQAAGCQVVQVISVVDRLDGAEELFNKAGIKFTPLLTITDLGLKSP